MNKGQTKTETRIQIQKRFQSKLAIMMILLNVIYCSAWAGLGYTKANKAMLLVLNSEFIPAIFPLKKLHSHSDSIFQLLSHRSLLSAEMDTSPSSLFLCPLSKQRLVDPVILGTTGVTFEKTALEAYLADQPDPPLHPLTCEPLEKESDRIVIPNHALKQLLEREQEIISTLLAVTSAGGRSPADRGRSSRSESLDSLPPFSPSRYLLSSRSGDSQDIAPITPVRGRSTSTVSADDGLAVAIGNYPHTPNPWGTAANSPPSKVNNDGSIVKIVTRSHPNGDIYEGEVRLIPMIQTSGASTSTPHTPPSSSSLATSSPVEMGYFESKHGFGRLSCQDGSSYEGLWRYGQRHGQGKQIYADGSIYQGEWKADKKHGKGEQNYENGDHYDGDWQDGLRHGKGKFLWSKGSSYDGDWKHGRKHGKGKYQYANGDIFIGDYKDNEITGNGVLTCTNGSQFLGEWRHDKLQGKGKSTYADGGSYEGEWKGGKFDGKGRRVYGNGEIYEGQFVADKRHGQGFHSFPVAPSAGVNGVVPTSTVANAVANIDAAAQGGASYYQGDFKDDLRHGFGRRRYADGDIYEGEWKNGKMCGKGKINFGDGLSEFVGRFKDNRIASKWKAVFED